jgi:pimeloyl-ACP methyl ester carboxylesterase
MRAHNAGVGLYYGTAGDGETVAFVEDLGYGAWLWGWQHRALAGPFETLTWDLRGTGRSDAADECSVPAMAADLEAVLADHGARTAHLVGSGLGGMVALEYALSYGRASTLTLFGTAAAGDGLPAEPREAAFAPRDDPEALERSLEPVLSAEFRRENPDVVAGIAGWRADDDADREAWTDQSAAMDAFDATDRLYEVTEPALVVHGGADELVPPERGRRLADGLPRGEFVGYEGAGHLVFVERSRPVNDRLLGFLLDHADVDPNE